MNKLTKYFLEGLIAFTILSFSIYGLTVLLQSEPETLWERHYHSTGYEDFFSVKQTSDSGFVCVGRSNPFDPNYYEDLWLVKTDKNGYTIWTKTYGTASSSEYGQDIIEMYNNDLIMVGGYDEGFGFNNDVLIMRTDSNGNIKWSKSYDFSESNDLAYSITKTFDNYYMVAAYASYWDPSFHKDIWLLKINSRDGDTLWTKSYDLGSKWEWPAKVIQSNDGGFVIVGTIPFGPDSTGNDLFIFKTDIDGNLLWKKIYGGYGYEGTGDVEQTADGGFILVGNYKKEEDSDIWLLKTDANGDTLWTRTYGGLYNDIGYSLEITSDGGYILTGRVETSENGDWDVYVVRTDSIGDTLWTKTYGISPLIGYSVQITYDGGYIIGGTTQPGSGFALDGYLVRLGPDPITGIESEYESRYPSDFVLYQNYPNPFNPATTINYQIPEISFVTLKVYDVLGNEIATLVNEKKPVGSYEVDWNASNAPSGVYFYQLKTKGYLETKKMILLR